MTALYWVTKKEVFKYKADGERLFNFSPCPKDNGSNDEKHNKSSSKDDDDDNEEDTEHEKKCKGNLITLAINPSDSTAWIAWRKDLLKIGGAGETLLWLSGFKQIQALDIGLPRIGIKINEPPDGAILDTDSITVKGIITDPTAAVTVNGINGLVSGDTFEVKGVPLSQGVNTITAAAVNLAGLTASDTIQVTYQPPLPPLTISITSPQNLAISKTSRITVTGEVSVKNARITVNGISASVSENSFTAVDIPLSAGENLITALAYDEWGRNSASFIKVYYNPLDLNITSPLNGDILNTQSLDVSGTVSDITASVEVNGITASVSSEGYFTAFGISLSEGLNEITANAVNSEGERAADVISVTYQPPLVVAITSPEGGAKFSTAAINVTGTISYSKASVTVNGIPAVVSGNTFTVYDIPITLGENQITAASADEWWRSTADTIIVFYAWLELTITAPSNGDILSTPSVDISGTVSDPAAYVVVNGREASVLSDGSFIASGIKLASGLNEIIAQGTNLEGQRAGDTINVTYIPSKPSQGITIISPDSGAIIETPKINIAGITNDPNAAVIVGDTAAKVDDSLFNTSVYVCEGGWGSGSMETAWDCSVTVTAYSKDGQNAVSSNVVYTYNPLENPLTIDITEPSHNTTITYSPVKVKGVVNDRLSSVSPTIVTVNGYNAEVTGDTFIAYVPLLDGVNYITAIAKNAADHSAYSETRTVIYEPPTKPLAVTITSPIDNAVVNYPAISLAGDVSDSTAIVEINGIKAEQNFRTYKISSFPLSLGENIITVKAVRPNGEIAASIIKVIYDPNYPSPLSPILSKLPEYAITPFIEISGLTSSGYNAEIFINGINQGQISADANGIFKKTINLPKEGENHISARVIDKAGNTSNLSAEAIIIRDTIKPEIHLSTDSIRDGLISRVHIEIESEPITSLDITIDNSPNSHYIVKTDEKGIFHLDLNLSAGIHPINITAADKAGNVSRSNSFLHINEPSEVYVYVGGNEVSRVSDDYPMPPVIDPIPNPISDTVITVEGNAYAGFGVELYRNNELTGMVITDNSGRFKFTGVTLIQGKNIIKVRQTEREMFYKGVYYIVKPADSSEIIVDVVSVLPRRPNVKIEFPLNGSVIDAEFISLRGTTDYPNAYFYVNESYRYNDRTIRLGDQFISNHKIPLHPGENTLWVEGVTYEGLRGVDKITVYSKNDASTPLVQITDPVSGEINSRDIIASGTADSSVHKVFVNDAYTDLNNGLFISDRTFSAGAYTFDPDDTTGSMSRFSHFPGSIYSSILTAWGIDGNGKIGHKDIRFNYRYAPTPWFYITYPWDGAIVNTSPVIVTGEVYDSIDVTVNGIQAEIEGNLWSAKVELPEGGSYITAISKNSIKARAKRAYITYQPLIGDPLQSLSIESPSLSLPVGKSMQLHVTGLYKSGKKVDLTNDAGWTSKDTSLLKVNHGLITALSAGNTTINATYENLTSNITISAAGYYLERIEINANFVLSNGEDSYLMTMNEGKRFAALGYFSNKTTIDLTSAVIWASSNPAVASVTSTGTVSALSKGTTTITALYDSIFASAALTVNPSPVYLFITSPADGSIINNTEVIVRGKVITKALEAGVTINGTTAQIYGDEFTVNHLPLYQGNNVIVAKGIDNNGVAAETQIIINAQPKTNYITLAANIESGISPLDTTLTIDSTFPIITSSITYTKTSTIPAEITAVSKEEYKIKLTAEGIYTFTANVTDVNGQTYTDTAAITVLNRDELDALLKGKWEGMKGKLIAGDVEGAVGYFAERSRDIFREHFTLLSSILAQVGSEMGNITLVKVKDNYTEYDLRTVRNGITYSFQLIFVRDADGTWRIRNF